MANSLNIDLHNKDVIIDERCLKEEFKDIRKRVFHVEGGFGASAVTIGSKIAGYFQFEGQEETNIIGGYFIERLATPEEVKEAKKLKTKK